VSTHMTARAITKVRSSYEGLSIVAITRGAASKALNEAIAQKKAAVEDLIKGKASELEAIIKKLTSEAKLSATKELIKSFNAIFSAYPDRDPLTISDTIDQAIAKARYNAGLVAPKDLESVLAKLTALLTSGNLEKYPEFRRVIQAAIDTINIAKSQTPKLAQVTDSSVGVRGEASKSTVDGVTVINISYDVTNKTGVIKLTPRFEIVNARDQSLLKIKYLGAAREYYKAGDNLYQLIDSAAVSVNRSDITRGGSVKVEFTVLYNDVLIGKYIATLSVKRESSQGGNQNSQGENNNSRDRDEDSKNHNEGKNDYAKHNATQDKITISEVENGNKQASIKFNILSANGKGYSVYLSETGANGTFKLYTDVNFNSKGAHVKGLTNGKTYYAYITYENTVRSGTVTLKPDK